MEGKYSVALRQIIQEFALIPVYSPDGYEERLVMNDDLNRSGLQLAGFFDFFDPTRIQLIGKVEASYIDHLTSDERLNIFEKLFEQNVPCLIYTRYIDPDDECVEMAQKYKIPLFKSAEETSDLMASLIAYLKLVLAPRITRHGVLVEVYGEGILLLGDSGVGKSETAIELVKRGHRLIADDAVEIKKVSNKTLVGTSPEIIRHYVELRGIGVVDVRRIFGMGAIKETEKIDLVINLEQWREDKIYDRLGAETNYTEILEINIPSLTVPVKPGRNLAIILEVAAMNNRQKKMGYNAAQELLHNLGMAHDAPPAPGQVLNWAQY